MVIPNNFVKGLWFQAILSIISQVLKQFKLKLWYHVHLLSLQCISSFTSVIIFWEIILIIYITKKKTILLQFVYKNVSTYTVHVMGKSPWNFNLNLKARKQIFREYAISLELSFIIVLILMLNLPVVLIYDHHKLRYPLYFNTVTFKDFFFSNSIEMMQWLTGYYGLMYSQKPNIPGLQICTVCVCLVYLFRSFIEVFATAMLTFLQQYLSVKTNNLFFQITTQVNRSKLAGNMNFMSVFEIWAGRYDKIITYHNIFRTLNSTNTTNDTFLSMF